MYNESFQNERGNDMGRLDLKALSRREREVLYLVTNWALRLRLMCKSASTRQRPTTRHVVC